MAAKKRPYIVNAKFPGDPYAIAGEGEGGSQPVLGFVDAWHKDNFDGYNVANEYIGSRIGQQIGLPVPPFAVSHRTGENGLEFYFSSIDFNSQREALAPVDPDIFSTSMPFEATGIILFDILIANMDRWNLNLAVDDVDKPTVVQVFDHDRCLFLGFEGQQIKGAERLHRERDRIGTIKYVDGTERQHFLMGSLRSAQHFEVWYHRIDGIPDWLIKETCANAVGIGLTKSEADEAEDFLRYRKRNIRRLVSDHQVLFEKINDWPDEGLLEGVPT